MVNIDLTFRLVPASILALSCFLISTEALQYNRKCSTVSG